MKNPGAVWLITMEAAGYSWAAVGRTQDEAREALQIAWNERHPVPWRTFARAHEGETPDVYFGSYVRPLKMGEGERY